MKKYLPALLAAIFVAGIVIAQDQIQIQGVDSSSVVRLVLVDSAGRVVTTTDSTSASSGTAAAAHAACTNTTMNVGTTGTACPAVARTDRRTVSVQLVQAGQVLRITSDGSTVATATAGLQIGSSDVYSDNLLGSVPLSCRCDAATCAVMIAECP